MYQRIERLRKNAFGSMCVFGDDSHNTIAGVWFWKGHELVFPVIFFTNYLTNTMPKVRFSINVMIKITFVLLLN